MTARVRSTFYGSSGFVAARPAVRIVGSRCVDSRPAAEPKGLIASHHGAADTAASSVALAA